MTQQESTGKSPCLYLLNRKNVVFITLPSPTTDEPLISQYLSGFSQTSLNPDLLNPHCVPCTHTLSAHENTLECWSCYSPQHFVPAHHSNCLLTLHFERWSCLCFLSVYQKNFSHSPVCQIAEVGSPLCLHICLPN